MRTLLELNSFWTKYFACILLWKCLLACGNIYAHYNQPTCLVHMKGYISDLSRATPQLELVTPTTPAYLKLGEFSGVSACDLGGTTGIRNRFLLISWGLLVLGLSSGLFWLPAPCYMLETASTCILERSHLLLNTWSWPWLWIEERRFLE